MIKVLFGLGTILVPKMIKRLRNWRSKNHSKTDSSKTCFFAAIWRFRRGKTLIFEVFWDDLGFPRASFSDGFLGFRFGLFFQSFFMKIATNTKTWKSTNCFKKCESTIFFMKYAETWLKTICCCCVLDFLGGASDHWGRERVCVDCLCSGIEKFYGAFSFS